MTFGQPDRFTLLQNQGLWWAPDGSRLLISRVDTSQVQQYWISDQADPGARPVQVRYPRVGTPNAEVSLWLVGLDGSRVVVQTDQGEFEYLTAVTWDGHGPLIAVQSRDQRRLEVRAVDPGTGQASVRVHAGRRAAGTTVIVRQALGQPGTTVIVRRAGSPDRSIASKAEPPGLDLRIELIRVGEREIRSALLLPSWHESGAPPLPVLIDSYGGAAQRVFLAQTAPFLVSQWFAEQGFAVIVADGRGTPGRDPAWERATRGDIATPVLEDQIAALQAIAATHPGVLDLRQVVIRRWSRDRSAALQRSLQGTLPRPS